MLLIQIGPSEAAKRLEASRLVFAVYHSFGRHFHPIRANRTDLDWKESVVFLGEAPSDE